MPLSHIFASSAAGLSLFSSCSPCMLILAFAITPRH
jgi:hypothetical protein